LEGALAPGFFLGRFSSQGLTRGQLVVGRRESRRFREHGFQVRALKQFFRSSIFLHLVHEVQRRDVVLGSIRLTSRESQSHQADSGYARFDSAIRASRSFPAWLAVRAGPPRSLCGQ
jgi:hypothetical protein